MKKVVAAFALLYLYVYACMAKQLKKKKQNEAVLI